jgi:superfamily II DNA/RNA helicase
VVVATPGRLAELLSLGSLSISKLKWLVLDEADRLLSLGFEDQLRVIITACPAKRQTMLFSATMSPTLHVLEAMSLRNPFRFDQAQNGPLLTVKVRICHLYFSLFFLTILPRRHCGKNSW